MIPLTFLLVISQAFILVSHTHGICYRNISIRHGRVDYGNTYYVVTCDSGYELNGKKVVYCVRNEWEPKTPTCSEGRNSDAKNAHGGHNYYETLNVDEQKASGFETDNNPCRNFGCQHICNKNHGYAICRCRNGYTLASDGKSCIETPEIGGHPESSYLSSRRSADPCYNHQCEHFCQVENGQAQCRCRRGYIRNKEDQTRCDVNRGPPVHPANPCDVENGGCDQKCTRLRGQHVVCSCHAGYYLDRDRTSCIASRSVPRPVSCSSGNGGCQHSCTMRGNEVVCSCPPGYRLHTDRKSCNALIFTQSCDVGNGGCQHLCSQRGNTVVCSCPPGSTLANDRKQCIALPRVTCDIDNGGCEYYCSNVWNGVTCQCPSGYRLAADRKNCVDIDECRQERLNTCQQICENTEGSYRCHCRPGYVMIENKCEGCRRNSYWSTEVNGCIECPANSFTLTDGKTSVSDCSCRPGYIGSPTDNIPCLDIDECASNNFGCSHTCVNIPGDAFCSCPVGFDVDKDNKTCIDINECSIKNGGCEGSCINTNGSFQCKCTPGFVSSNKDHYSCDDVDECSENNGGCEQLCVNFRGGYYCACREGYRLDSFLKNCTEILCPAIPVPHFSTKRCKKDSRVLPEMDGYPIGTVCSFRCLSGFKDASESSSKTCLENGTWEGRSAVCKSQHCPALKVPENGDVHPSSCETEGNEVKQKCTFTCRQGYKLAGFPVFTCKNNLSWDKPIDNIPVCQHDGIRASIECTRDINATLLPGKSSQNVSIPEPVTNMKSYGVFPEDVAVGKPAEFRAGKTKVVFTASSPSSNRTAKCVTTVHVIDKEPPVFLSCPGYILIENAKVDGEIVTWENPEVTDNVEVVSLASSVTPNTTLAPGSYVVEYVARDAAGNTESCSFKIDVVRFSCDGLKDPVHGEANCMDWIYGRLCQPLCDDGYMRDPAESQFYSCGDSGAWDPGEKISDCLPYTEKDSSECPDGSELKIIEETEEEICLECPSNAVWSSATRTCEITKS